MNKWMSVYHIFMTSSSFLVPHSLHLPGLFIFTSLPPWATWSPFRKTRPDSPPASLAPFWSPSIPWSSRPKTDQPTDRSTNRAIAKLISQWTIYLATPSRKAEDDACFFWQAQFRVQSSAGSGGRRVTFSFWKEVRSFLAGGCATCRSGVPLQW